MKKQIILLFSLLFISLSTLDARPVDAITASKAGANFLRFSGEDFSQLVLNQVLTNETGIPSVYIVNIDHQGFIIVSADDEVEPVLGYSFNGVFDTAHLAPNFRQWLNSYQHDIAQIVTRRAQGKSAFHSSAAVAEWNALRSGNAAFYATKETNEVQALLTSTWAQGDGYNNYCPEYNNSHALVGCGATAMAQIIRYHRYPATGFGSSSYFHAYYGWLTADHDSVIYDYNNMPDILYFNSSAATQHEVAQLCYHCGVALHMNYQNPQYTNGSGSYIDDMPAAFLHFGYVGCIVKMKSSYSEEDWRTMLRSELQKGRPLLYQGFSDEGGHAFVCDGYRTVGNKFHFNWGWSGSCDGYYTLTDMIGFTSTQGAVFNITPSLIAANTSRLYVDSAASATGTGASWEQPTSNFVGALYLRGLYKNGQIWVKSGTYYGDTMSSTAFPIASGVMVYGGFAGNETELTQRNAESNPTILDGRNERTVLNCDAISKPTAWYGFVIQNGRASVAAARVFSNLTLQSCQFRNNTAIDSGNIVSIAGGVLKKCIIEDNQATGGSIVRMNAGTLEMSQLKNNSALTTVFANESDIKNTLVAHNEGIGLWLDGHSNAVNCHSVCNDSTGVVLSSQSTLRNSIVWNNQSPIAQTGNSMVSYSAIEGDTIFSGEGNIILASAGVPSDYAPQFTMAGEMRGHFYGNESWRLLPTSPCVNAGDTNTSGLPRYDLDGGNRVYNERVDMGCYEYSGIDIFCPDPNVAQLRVYPNPTHADLTVEWTGEALAQRQVEITDLLGRRIMVGNSPDGNPLTLNLNKLPQGIYLLRSGSAVTKIVVY